MTRLFSYRMTTDSGFAPNPFGEWLTLATCKPQIRSAKRKDDWIAGFAGLDIDSNARAGNEKLVYLMKVLCKIPIHDYYTHKDFQYKIPSIDKAAEAIGDFSSRRGDNIYYCKKCGGADPNCIVKANAQSIKSDYHEVDNDNHCDEIDHDLKGDYVLVAEIFYYFGKELLSIPEDIVPKIPPKQHPHGHRTHDIKRAEAFIKFVEERELEDIPDPNHFDKGKEHWRSC